MLHSRHDHHSSGHTMTALRRMMWIDLAIAVFNALLFLYNAVHGLWYLLPINAAASVLMLFMARFAYVRDLDHQEAQLDLEASIEEMESARAHREAWLRQTESRQAELNAEFERLIGGFESQTHERTGDPDEHC